MSSPKSLHVRGGKMRKGNQRSPGAAGYHFHGVKITLTQATYLSLVIWKVHMALRYSRGCIPEVPGRKNLLQVLAAHAIPQRCLYNLLHT